LQGRCDACVGGGVVAHGRSDTFPRPYLAAYRARGCDLQVPAGDGNARAECNSISHHSCDTGSRSIGHSFCVSFAITHCHYYAFSVSLAYSHAKQHCQSCPDA
jgi:hypothetical protein